VPATPKVEARNEISDNTDSGDGAADGYEQLRRRALSGDTDGWRLGLGVLQHRGVAAWLHARTATATPQLASPRSAPAAAIGADAELVGLLASMALGVAAPG
jgi:hypothetical protein